MTARLRITIKQNTMLRLVIELYNAYLFIYLFLWIFGWLKDINEYLTKIFIHSLLTPLFIPE